MMVLPAIHSQAQCVVFNEILINGAGPNDGSNSPNTEEWVELYNTCGTAVDMSCFVLTDGDFTVTFPQGSIIQPNDYFTVGSSNSGFAVDLNWGTCNCTSGNTIGVFTNGSEQLVLVDENEVVFDAVTWGGGDLPLNISSTSTQGCPNVSLNLTNNNTNFIAVPPTGSAAENGCSVGLGCDGGTSWQVMCGADITPGASNSGMITTVDFTCSNQTLCTGDCIDFSDLSTPSSTGWNWQFEGAIVSNSSVQNPTGICYDNVGLYEVSLTVTNACGSYSLSLDGYIQVDNGDLPEIVAEGPTTFCEGESVTLQANGTGNYNWTRNGVLIAGITANEYIATESGIYAASNTSAFCPGISNEIEVVVIPATIVEFQSSEQTICTGSCIQFEDLSSTTADSWNWTFEGAATANSSISNPTNICYDQTGSFDVTLEITNACGTYDLVLTDYILVQSNVAPVLSADGSTILCDGESVILNTTGVGPFEWTLDGTVIVGASASSYEAMEAGVYTASNTNENCPAVSNSISISIQDDVEVSITPGEDVALCESSALLTAITIGNVQWLLNGTPIAGANQTTYNATEDGDYQFEAFGPGLCPATSDQINISLNNEITLTVSLSSDTICDGEKATISAFGFYDSIVWSNGATTDSIEVYQSGNYTAQVSFSSCVTDTTVSITVIELPIADAGEDLFSPCDGMMQLTGSGDGVLTWYKDQEILGDSATVFIEAPTINTVYTLDADISGCKTTDEVLVTADCISIYIPNAFTPNDDGVNDVFKVEARGVLNYEFFIFNRWGDVVFESKDPDDVWTGGNPDYYVPDGVYTYLVKGVNSKFEDILDSKHARGTVTIVR
jgi:gliding motility-associated-like protein